MHIENVYFKLNQDEVITDAIQWMMQLQFSNNRSSPVSWVALDAKWTNLQACQVLTIFFVFLGKDQLFNISFMHI